MKIVLAKKFEEPKVRGQRDVKEPRSEFIVAKKSSEEQKPQKKSNVVDELSSKEGDDFDVEEELESTQNGGLIDMEPVEEAA